MGSFSYTCQLTGVPITCGNKAALVPLISSNSGRYYDNGMDTLLKFGKNHLCSNDGQDLYFRPLCFPIFGEYNDYGGLENIVEDDNTKCLEKFFDLTIQEIVDVMCDGRKDEYASGSEYSDCTKILKKKNPRHQFLLTVSGTWLHGDVYEKLASIPSKGGYGDRVDLGVHGILDALGFKHVGEGSHKKDTQKRYNKLYEKDGLQINSDGNWLYISSQEQIYEFKQFYEYCKKKGVNIDISEIDKKGRDEQIYDYVMPQLNKLRVGDRWNSERVIYMLLGKDDDYSALYDMFDDFSSEELDKLLLEVTNPDKKKASESVVTALTSVSNSKKGKSNPKPEKINFSKFYFEEIREQQKAGNKDFLKKNIIDFHKVENYFYPTGRFWYPVGTSCQDGGYREVETLLQVALDVNKAIMKERGYDEEDEDE